MGSLRIFTEGAWVFCKGFVLVICELTHDLTCWSMVKPPAYSSKRNGDRRAARDLIKQDLAQVLPAIWEADTLDQSIQEALSAIRAEFGHGLLWVGLYDRFNHKLTTRGVMTNGPRRFSHKQLSLEPGDLLEQVIVQQQPLIIADIREDAKAGTWGRIAKNFELQGTVILPIQRKGICFGLIVLGSRRWGVTPGILENSTLLAINNALAEAIHQNALESQRQQTKQPAKPLLALLRSMANLPGLDARLQAIADETQTFVAAPTHIFWIESRGRQVWCRAGKSKGKVQSLPISEIQSLYQTLSTNEMVVVGELEGSLKASIANRLMQSLSAQSLMAAPIFYQEELQGFIAVSGNSPRIWSDAEKDYLQGIAQLVGLAMPTSEVDEALSQLKSDHLLSAGITRSIHNDRDWQHVLGLCSEQLAARMGTDQLLILSANPDRGGFDLCYQTGLGMVINGARAQSWLPLNDVDDKLLRRAHTPVSIEDLNTDLKFAAWRQPLQAMDVQSLLVSNTSPGHAPEGVVIVTDKSQRRWTQAEREVVQTLSSQIGLILHQWQLQRQTDQQAQLHETFQWGMRSLQRLSQLDVLDQAAARHISQLLQVPLVGIVAWENGADFARLTSTLSQGNAFQIDSNRQIPLATDAIINWAIATEGLLTLRIEDLPTGDENWITAPQGAQLLIMALRTAPEHEPNAMVIVADSASRQWSDEQTTLLAIVTNQLAWCRRHIKLTHTMLNHQQQLTQLNWYKHHQLEDLSRVLTDCAQQLTRPEQSSIGQQQLLLQKLEKATQQLTHTNSHEQWQLQFRSNSTPLTGLLKRATERANPLIQTRQLWSKVHCESNLTLTGDIHKIEFVLYELISEACRRSPIGDRIDIWCRPIDEHWLEVSITGEGKVAPAILKELETGRSLDLLSPSTLQQPENSHLWVCQALTQQLGGEFSLSQMEDGRTLSRLMLPLTSSP